ncbi:MAG: endonuclease MutS2 [Clostridia bacterium]|nr:endonuclease MutS2 [Clostridia bacterium]
MPMENRHYLALELDRILEKLAALTSCEDARERAFAVRPADNLQEARDLLQETTDAHMLLAKFGGPSFGGLTNVNNRLYIASTGGVLSMGDLLSVGATLRAIRALDSWYSSCEGVDTSLTRYFESLTPQKHLEDRIFACILSEDRMDDHASPTLYDIRRSLLRQESKIRDQLDHIIHSPHNATVLQDTIVTMRNGRFVVPVKREHRTEIAGLVQDTSDSGATVFIEPMAVVEANNKIRELKGQEQEEMERILAELSDEAGDIYNETKLSYDSAVELNVIFAKAHLAYSMKATAPHLNAEGIVDLRAARHPLIDPKTVVATDIRLGEDFDTLVITGPNTGGKTVSIKTVGLLTLMAAAGLMIPCADESKIAVFRHVYADIGDEQSIEQSLSTFSGHMSNIVGILQEADEHSLVLIDELGAGTDPVEGAALAIAILEQLHAQGAKIAATTHYAELKAYALQNPRVENASCEFDIKTLSPTYRLIIGAPGRSNAFAISERLGMPPGVVDRARDLVSEENTEFESVVEKLEQSRAALETEREKAEQTSRRAEREKREAEDLRSSIEQLKENEVKKAREEAQRIVEKARREAAVFMDDLDRLKKEKKKVADLSQLSADAKRTIRRHEGELDDITNPITALAEDDDYVLPRPLQVGDTVIVADLAEPAEVTAVDEKKGVAEVTAGLIRTRVPISKLRLDEQRTASKQRAKEAANKPRSGAGRMPSDRGINQNVSTTVDLRGMTADEAILTLDRFLDLQLRVGIAEFTIIHGKGSGVLRKAVAQYLKKNPQVKEFRLGTFGEGEDGVTIVRLK